MPSLLKPEGQLATQVLECKSWPPSQDKQVSTVGPQVAQEAEQVSQTLPIATVPAGHVSIQVLEFKNGKEEVESHDEQVVADVTQFKQGDEHAKH